MSRHFEAVDSEMASRGLTVSQVSNCLGISESTLYGKQNEYKEFMDAIKKGRAEGLNKVSNALFEKATQGNVTAMIYYLKVRDRENWGENQPEPLREVPPMQIVVDSRTVRDSYFTNGISQRTEMFSMCILSIITVFLP